MLKKKLFKDRQTDRRTTQNYSSEPHNKSKTNPEIPFIKC